MTTQARKAPPDSTTGPWWPSKYGPDDQAGALNEITPGKVLEAVQLVRQGRAYDLAHVLHHDIPAFPGRTFQQCLTTSDHLSSQRDPDAGHGRNKVNWVVERITATQQMGTHMDGLNHLWVGDRSYNGYRLADIAEDYGTSRLGIDTLPQVVTRGLLLDVAASRGGERLEPGDVITVAGHNQHGNRTTAHGHAGRDGRVVAVEVRRRGPGGRAE